MGEILTDLPRASVDRRKMSDTTKQTKGMDFAKRHLEKLGWKEGSGLGRDSNGISEALKPKLKFDSSGLGHTRSDEFTYKWWDHAFNKAASSFDVVVQGDEGVVVRTNEVGAIKAKLGKVSTSGDFTYGFHKAGTLQNGEEEIIEAPTIIEEKDYSLKLSDEELFKLCGGRTAHKGARHGHRFSGKLARIAKQEALLLASMNSSTPSPTSVESKTSGSETVQDCTYEPVLKKKKKNKKKTKECDAEQEEVNPEKKEEDENVRTDLSEVCTSENVETTEQSKTKKKKKKDRVTPENTSDSMAVEHSSESNTKTKKKKKDKLANKNHDLPVASDDAELKPKKSKKRKRNDVDEL